MFCSALLLPWGLLFSVCACVCACIPLIGGLGAVSRGLSRILSSIREGREGERWAGGTRLSQLALGLPLGTGPPSTILPRDFRSLIASLSLSLSLSVSLQIHLLASYIPTLLELFCSGCRGVASWLKKQFLCVLCVFVQHLQKWVCLFTWVYVCNSVFVF